MSATLSTLGVTVVELLIPDRDGTLSNVVLGFDTAEQYRSHSNFYFGATIGRVAGRIADSRFVSGGLDRLLAANDCRQTGEEPRSH